MDAENRLAEVLCHRRILACRVHNTRDTHSGGGTHGCAGTGVNISTMRTDSSVEVNNDSNEALFIGVTIR